LKIAPRSRGVHQQWLRADLFSSLIAVTSLLFMLLYNVKIALLTMLLMGVFFLIRFSLIGPYQRAVDDSSSAPPSMNPCWWRRRKGSLRSKRTIWSRPGMR
jgi:hypothetical protein